MDRYQEQNWLVRLWRRRHYLFLPFLACKIYWKMRHKKNFKLAWSLAKGLSQLKMNWYYTQEETFEKIRRSKNEGTSRKARATIRSRDPFNWLLDHWKSSKRD